MASSSVVNATPPPSTSSLLFQVQRGSCGGERLHLESVFGLFNLGYCRKMCGNMVEEDLPCSLNLTHWTFNQAPRVVSKPRHQYQGQKRQVRVPYAVLLFIPSRLIWQIYKHTHFWHWPITYGSRALGTRLRATFRSSGEHFPTSKPQAMPMRFSTSMSSWISNMLSKLNKYSNLEMIMRKKRRHKRGWIIKHF